MSYPSTQGRLSASPEFYYSDWQYWHWTKVDEIWQGDLSQAGDEFYKSTSEGG